MIVGAKTAVHRLAEDTLRPTGIKGFFVSIGSYLFGEKVSKSILPSQDLSTDTDFINGSIQFERSFNRKLKDAKYEGFTVDRLMLPTYDGAQLETIDLQHPAQIAVPADQRHYIIYLVGNGECYQDRLRDMLADCEAMKYNTLSFNYRNVLNSTGELKSQLPLILDVISQIERLKAQGVAPRNIHLLGHSFGAAVATITAYIYFLHGENLQIFNGRSFNTAADFLYHLHQEGWDRTIWGNFDKFKLAITNLNLDPAHAYMQLPNASKRYIVVKKDKTKPRSVSDGVIDHVASLHKGLKTLAVQFPALEDPLQTGKKVVSFNNLAGCGHNDPIETLECKDDATKNGRDTYRAFFRT